MDETDQELMARHGITVESKNFYHYGGYRYERLADAVNYAVIQETLHSGKAQGPHSGSAID